MTGYCISTKQANWPKTNLAKCSTKRRTENQTNSLQANFYIKNRGGFAPLHLCCQNGHNETCRVLLLNGCKPDIKNNVRTYYQSKEDKIMIDFLYPYSMETPRCTHLRVTGTLEWLGFWSARDVMPQSRTRWWWWRLWWWWWWWCWWWWWRWWRQRR